MKTLGAGRTLVFSSLRFPHARATAGGDVQILRGDGSLITRGTTIVSVARGHGRTWMPDANDATWRTFSEIDIADPIAVENFVKFRGDPYGALSASSSISTAAWVDLIEALRLAASAWGPPDADGTSYPAADPGSISRTRDFLDQVGGTRLLVTFAVLPRVEGLGLAPRNLAAFMVARAIGATAPFHAMRRCSVCRFWFEVTRTSREPDFCSASCRSIYHQREKRDGLIQEESHREGHHKVAGGVDRAGAGRQDAAKDKELRKRKGSTRPRPTHGARN
jgi:hypothetical protein